MVKYQETSQFCKEKLFWMGLSIIALIIWMGIEFQAYLSGKPSFLGIAYIGLFCGLLLWRYAVRYTYVLSNQELIITSQFFYISRTFTINLDSLESYCNQYKGNIFKRKSVSRLVHRYSAADDRVTRMLTFTEKEKSCGLLLKISDTFMNKLKTLRPKIYEIM
ncbi:hypothetical protein [Pelosinus propionicus]|uniref:Uncharacterized protein n=1 Tax=Pelosinus propionicus DSM 13327 TaxID=1123291 RepID=A0A1I4JMX8_9FIRM|nr:hypothetical protein [Pelosinus propionicus]SFL67955.1 hypothetical protein SAMN04490355_101339 [Pelosinus propionicus DSM 13327]